MLFTKKTTKKISILLVFSLISTPFYSPYKKNLIKANTNNNVLMDSNEYINNEIIVGYKKEKCATAQYSKTNYSLSNNTSIEKITDDTLLISATKKDIDSVLTDLKSDPNVEYAQPNYVYYANGDIDDTISELKNNTFFYDQWGLHSTDSYEVDIDYPEALNEHKNISNNNETIVAVIDSGVRYDHPDLINRMWINETEIPNDDIDNDNNGFIDDIYGWNFIDNSNVIYNINRIKEDNHATHCAGVISSENNNIGVVGVASNTNTKIMSLKVLQGTDADPNTCSGYTSDIIKAIKYAEKNGADICNLSLGGPGYNVAFYNTIKKSNMLFIVAAGNNGQNLSENDFYPAKYDCENIITVANLDNSGKLHASSNYNNEIVDIAAPGTYILSTGSDNNYLYMTGTSMATPMVSGAIAFLHCYYPELSLLSLKEVLMESTY